MGVRLAPQFAEEPKGSHPRARSCRRGSSACAALFADWPATVSFYAGRTGLPQRAPRRRWPARRCVATITRREGGMRATGWWAMVMVTAGSASAQQRWLGPDERLVATGRIVEFPLPHAGSGPTTIAVAPDGTVWFTESSGNRIGRMAPDGGELIEYDVPTAGSAPRIIALGADGNLWFSEHAAAKMARITPAGVITEFPLPTPDSQPRAIALGADGNIWFGMFAAGKIGRITPSGQITEFAIPTPNSGPRALAAGPDGNVWFSEFHASKIGRITPGGEITEFALPRPDSGPGDITAGADGALWFIELNGTMDGRVVSGNRVGRITVQGQITEFDIPSAAGSPTNVAVGPDRNVWYTKGAALGRVTPAGQITEFPLPADARAVGLTAGSDRQPPARLLDRLWYADGTGNKIAYLEFE